MYSVTQLAKMFDTTRQTIYRKFKDNLLKQYIIDTKHGKKLKVEGLSQFQIVMANSKTYKESQLKLHSDNTVTQEYINNLKSQIEELKEDKRNLIKDKEVLANELETKNNQIKNTFNLLENSQKKILLLSESKNKSWWKFWNQRK